MKLSNKTINAVCAGIEGVLVAIFIATALQSAWLAVILAAIVIAVIFALGVPYAGQSHD